MNFVRVRVRSYYYYYYYYYYYVGVVHELSVAETVDLVGEHPLSSRTVRPRSSVQPRLRVRLGVHLSVRLSPPLKASRVSYGVGGDARIDLRRQVEQVCSEQVGGQVCSAGAY